MVFEGNLQEDMKIEGKQNKINKLFFQFPLLGLLVIQEKGTARKSAKVTVCTQNVICRSFY